MVTNDSQAPQDERPSGPVIRRDTRQKRLIRALMDGNMSHPTADELYDQARALDPTISRGTIFRNLSAMSASGELRRVRVPQGADHFDSNDAPHYHFFCRVCTRIFDTELPYNEAYDQPIPGLESALVEGHRVVIEGVCGDCRAANDD